MSHQSTERPPQAYAVKHFAADHGLSRSQVYELIYSGELRAVRSGKRILIPRQAAEEWLASLPEFEVAQ
jgi:excisionase family DNA binding protein